MALPLPKVVPDTMPGGNFITSMMGANALRQSNLENQIKQVQAQYAPLTTQAEAASKLAYANLMGPQFLSKLMGHPEILANMTEDQRNQALKMVYGAGTGQGTGANIFTQLMQPPAPTTGNKLLDLFVNKVKGVFGGNQTQAPMQPQSNFQPQVQNNAMQYSPQDVQAAIQAYQNSPEAKQQAQTEGMMTIPNTNELMNWYKNRGNVPVTQPLAPTPKTWPERTAEFKGIESEGTRKGTLRADDIKELNDIAFNANTMQGTLNELSNIVNTPEFREIRQIPIAGQHEIGWYAKFGTPAQKRLIGRFLSEQGQVVVNAAGQFKGAFRAGEQGLINTMKVNPSDMPEVASGKIQGMSLINQMLSQRAALTAKLMEDHHISKGKAMEIADKQIDGNAIRKQLENSIMITIKNKKTGQKMTVPLNRAKEMGVPNV